MTREKGNGKGKGDGQGARVKCKEQGLSEKDKTEWRSGTRKR